MAVVSDGTRNGTNVHDAVAAHVDDLDNSLREGAAADDEGPGDDSSRISGLAQKSQGRPVSSCVAKSTQMSIAVVIRFMAVLS
jgi:hypothetical protein